MKNKNLSFETYDDNNLEHVMAGPDYGQPGYEDWELVDLLKSLPYEDFCSLARYYLKQDMSCLRDVVVKFK